MHKPRRGADLVCSTFLLCLFASVANPQTDAPYEVFSTKNVMVRMRDGVRLATDVHRPARGGVAVERKFPVLLERTPYNKNGGAAVGNFVSQGYVVVLQDVRGRYESEGHWSPVRD